MKSALYSLTSIDVVLDVGCQLPHRRTVRRKKFLGTHRSANTHLTIVCPLQRLSKWSRGRHDHGAAFIGDRQHAGLGLGLALSSSNAARLLPSLPCRASSRGPRVADDRLLVTTCQDSRLRRPKRADAGGRWQPQTPRQQGRGRSFYLGFKCIE